jgi:hypothetical protein
MELELATSKELIEELMRRETFTGVLVEMLPRRDSGFPNVKLHRSFEVDGFAAINILGIGVRACSLFLKEEGQAQIDDDLGPSE